MSTLITIKAVEKLIVMKMALKAFALFGVGRPDQAQSPLAELLRDDGVLGAATLLDRSSVFISVATRRFANDDFASVVEQMRAGSGTAAETITARAGDELRLLISHGQAEAEPVTDEQRRGQMARVVGECLLHRFYVYKVQESGLDTAGPMAAFCDKNRDRFIKVAWRHLKNVDFDLDFSDAELFFIRNELRDYAMYFRALPKIVGNPTVTVLSRYRDEVARADQQMEKAAAPQPTAPVKPKPAAKPEGKSEIKKETKAETKPVVEKTGFLRPQFKPRYKATLRTESSFNDYMEYMGKQLNALERVALRERSFRSRDLLAQVASNGLMTYDSLMSFCRKFLLDEPFNPFRQVQLSSLSPRALYALARVTHNQALYPTDAEDARTLYRYLQATGNDKSMRSIDAISHVLNALHFNELQDAAALLERTKLLDETPVERVLLVCNLIRKKYHVNGQFDRDHLLYLNDYWQSMGIEPVRIGYGPKPAFYYIDTPRLNHHINDGPLISVLMTAYNPGEELAIAVDCILNQTWRNIELLVVDDASPKPNFDAIRARADADPRLRLIHAPKNGGTYCAKNIALEQARGEFVTCHDSDDWSHPRKLEIQMEPFVGRPDRMATISQWARVSPDLEFAMFSGGGRLCYDNPSSLMYRREPVLQKIGFYDSVRSGADSEFKARLEIAFETTTASIEEVPLSFGLTREDALTAGTIGSGWFSHDRKIYRAAWKHWHQALAAGEASPYVEREQPKRRFAVPPSIAPEPAVATNGVKHYDVVLISDYRMAGGNTVSIIEEIKAQSRAGIKTAVCQIGAFRKGFFHKEFIDPKVQELISAGLVDWIDIEDQVTTKLLTIRYPGVMEFSERMTSNIRADACLIILNQPPTENDSTDRRYDVQRCHANIRRTFRVEPKWAPIGPAVREAVLPVVNDGQLTETDWYNIIDIDEWACDRSHFVDSVPVIGRHSRDDYSKWPMDRDTLFTVYPNDDSVKVRILGGIASIKDLVKGIDLNWTVYPFNGVDIKDFVRSFDFFVYFHHPERSEAFGRTVIEAMASGAVPVLPASFRPLFGEAALYCRENEVTDLVKKLYADPQRYLALSEKAQNFVKNQFGYDAHITRLRDFGVEGHYHAQAPSDLQVIQLPRAAS